MAKANATGSAANLDLDLTLRLGRSRHASRLALDLQLGPPCHAAGLDLQLGPPGSDAGRGRGRDLDMERFAGSELLVESVGDGARSGKVVSPDQMAPDLAEVVDLGALGSEEAESRYVDAEQHDSTGSNNDNSAPAPNHVQVVQQPLIPWAGRVAGRLRRRWADPVFGRAPAMNPDDTVPAWVRRELHPISTLPLYYIGKKVLRKSDPQARFLLSASAADRIRGLLTDDEIASAGFNIDYKQISRNPGERASPTRNPGVAVSVYASTGKWWNLNLTKFPRSDGTVINGMGYRSFMENCSMVVGDGIELWAFRRSPYRLCFVMAK